MEGGGSHKIIMADLFSYLLETFLVGKSFFWREEREN